MKKDKKFHMRSFLGALAAFFGTTIGVVIFALPYTYNGAYGTALLMLLGAGCVLISLYSMYIDTLFQKGMGIHQLPGITGKIWGKNATFLVGILLLMGRTGIMFLYTMMMANFGSLLLEHFFGITPPLPVISGIITFIASMVIAAQAKIMSRVELYLTATIISIIGIVSSIGLFNHVNEIPSLFSSDLVLNGTSIPESLSHLVRIYGVTIGALSGVAAIPALKEIYPHRQALRNVTRVGTILVISIYALFSAFVIITSPSVTQDALHGLSTERWTILLALAGLMSISTAYIGVGYSLFQIYQHDYHASPVLAWLLTYLPPILLFTAGINNFVNVAAMIGGIIGGTEGLVIILNYWKVSVENGLFPMTRKILILLTAVVLGIGLILSI